MLSSSQCMPTVRGSLPGTLSGRPVAAFAPITRFRTRSCRATQKRFTVYAQSLSQPDQVCMHTLYRTPGLMVLPFVHTSCVLQTVQMSKRALLAGLASMAILPLQATQAHALGDSKTVRTTTSMSMPALHKAKFFLDKSFACSSTFQQLCRCLWLEPQVTQANEWCSSCQPKASKCWQAPG